MKKIAVASFTKTTVDFGNEIVSLLDNNQYTCITYNANRNANEVEAFTLMKNTREWIEENWKGMDAFIFVGGADIVVRLIATFLDDKVKDPAVLVVDEEGRFVVPILGNYLGGGNNLANDLARLLNAKSVITTSQEINKKFNIERFAERNNMEIGNSEQAKTISAAILDGLHIGFYCESAIEGELPSGLISCNNMKELEQFVHRIAIRNEYIIGMGLKEGVELSNVEELFLSQLDNMHVDLIQIKGIATIKEKCEEPALVRLAEKYKLSIIGFTKEELKNLHIIKNKNAATKCDANISERAALVGSEYGELVIRKVVGRGVTFAAAKKLKTIYFD